MSILAERSEPMHYNATEMVPKTLRVGLIGLGQVASGYGSPEEAALYCHADGLAHRANVTLLLG